jgi:hypothetical protein
MGQGIVKRRGEARGYGDRKRTTDGAYVAKASRNRVNLPEHGMTWEFSGRNAIQDTFDYEV